MPTPIHRVHNLSATDSHTDEIEEDCEDGTPLIGTIAEDGEFPKARHVFGLMGFLGFAIVYAMRVNLSVAIVTMVNQTAIPRINTSVADVCPVVHPTNETEPRQEGTFLWDEATQGIVLGSFFYGYVLTQVPGGRLAEVMGGKLIYGIGVFLTALFTLLTPPAAYWSLPALVVVRILEGMGEGVTYPAMHAMLAHWIPPLERSRFAAVVYAGSNIGTVISLPLAGWLCSLEFMGGWPLAFYIFGLLGIVWFVFWMFLVYDTPNKHPRISRSERNYIEKSIRPKKDDNGSLEAREDIDSIPFGAILTSLPVWAILITQCGQSWAFYTQLTELPTYMENILHFGIESNAVLNSLPSLTSWIFGIIASMIADHLLSKGYISLKNSYRLWNTVATIIPAIGLIGVAYIGCDWVWVMVMLAGLGAFSGAVYPGNQMNHIALSPKYAGTLYGLTNAAANTCGFLAPYVIGMIINGRETLERWRIVFYLAAGLSTAGNFIYLIFVSDEEQWWSKNRNRRNV